MSCRNCHNSCDSASARDPAVVRLVRDGCPVRREDEEFYTLDTRSLHVAQLQQLPFLNYPAVPTSGRPAPIGCSWAAQVDLESDMKPMHARDNREIKGGEPRTITLPLSVWPMHDLLCEKQMPDYRDPPQQSRIVSKGTMQTQPTKIFN